MASKIIVSSSALYRLLKEVVDSLIEEDRGYQIEVAHEGKKLRFGNHKRVLDVESKTDNSITLELASVTRLWMLTKNISDQPITLTFDNFNSCIFVSDIII